MEKPESSATASNPTDLALLCSCDICTPYNPKGACATMQPIGWCIKCGKPETSEQIRSFNGHAKSFLMVQTFRAT